MSTGVHAISQFPNHTEKKNITRANGSATTVKSSINLSKIKAPEFYLSPYDIMGNWEFRKVKEVTF